MLTTIFLSAALAGAAELSEYRSIKRCVPYGRHDPAAIAALGLPKTYEMEWVMVLADEGRETRNANDGMKMPGAIGVKLKDSRRVLRRSGVYYSRANASDWLTLRLPLGRRAELHVDRIKSSTPEAIRVYERDGKELGLVHLWCRDEI